VEKNSEQGERTAQIQDIGGCTGVAWWRKIDGPIRWKKRRER